ncbi:MAG: PilZ domain-containing protein [Chitinivibrionales bacterium]|nr:PilZ domain-containing protein [Chitinivibrionales bacterium]
MNEKRKLFRRKIIYYLKIRDRESGEIIGYLGDITAEGLMMVSQEAITIDRFFFLEIELPADIFGKKQIEVEAKCMWSKPDRNPSFFASGFQFFHIKSPEVETIIGLIAEYAFSANE